MLIDAHALMFRFHHAYGKLLQSEAGEETSIAFGFMKTLLAMLEVNPAPSHLVVVMDAPGKTFRSASLSKSFGTTALIQELCLGELIEGAHFNRELTISK